MFVRVYGEMDLSNDFCEKKKVISLTLSHSLARL